MVQTHLEYLIKVFLIQTYLNIDQKFKDQNADKLNCAYQKRMFARFVPGKKEKKEIHLVFEK